MDTVPEVIECFDISHISGTSVVGSMVQFRGGRPDKKNYRRFRIKTVEGVDDTAAIAEVVRRRYSRLKTENAQPFDLVVIDGGEDELNAGKRNSGGSASTSRSSHLQRETRRYIHRGARIPSPLTGGRRARSSSRRSGTRPTGSQSRITGCFEARR